MKTKKFVDYSFPDFAFNFYIGYMWYFSEIRSIYFSFYIVITWGKKKKKGLE